MRCAQCEEAEATLRCVDEDLHFCKHCSALLHQKKARSHHEIERIRPALVCDECEDVSAEVECFECGGYKTAMVFCPACSTSLHSRAARVGHRLRAIGRPKRQGREEPVGGRTVIDLTDFDSDEDHHNTIQPEDATRSLFAGQTRVKKEAEDGKFKSKALAETIHDRDTPNKSTTKSQKKQFANKKLSNPTSQPEESMKNTIANLIKLEDGKIVKEENPEKRQRRAIPAKLRKAASLKKEPNDPAKGTSSSASDINESDDDQGGVHRIKRGTVSLEAFVVDVDDQEDGPSGAIPEVNVETGIKKRIKNMLELGLHPDTPEFEAQQALKNAQRLLTKHNLQQAEVMKGNLTDTSTLIGGMRVVELRARGKTKHGRMDAWVQELGWVIADNFDCQYFFKAGTHSKPLRVVFYGISHNADCAGYAFAATFNRITKMSAAYVVSKACDDDKENVDVKLQQVNRSIYTRVARANYRKGIVAGLKAAVKLAQRMRNENVSEYERKPKVSEYEKKPKVESRNNEFPCDSDVGDDFHSCSDHSSICEDDVDDDTTASTGAERCMAITALVLHSQKVGEEFLKQRGIKIRKRTVQNRLAAWNEEAFVQGKKDSETIDINQKSITSAKTKQSRGSGN